jgi:ABC-type uncharacterized transport system permease subunit
MQNFRQEIFKLWFLVRYSMLSAQAGGLVNVLTIMGSSLTLIAMIYVWKLGNASVAIFSYLLIGRIYKSLAENYFVGTLSGDIISGQLSRVLLLPTATTRMYFFVMLGKRVFRNLIEFVGFTCATLICLLFLSVQIEYNFSTLWILVLFLPITFTINHFTGQVVGCLAFIIADKRDFMGIDNIYFNFRSILAGWVVPLDLLPFAGFFVSTPFAWQLHQPMQIYLGKVQGIDILWVWLQGLAWCLFVYFLAKIVFRLGLKYNESTGL